MRTATSICSLLLALALVATGLAAQSEDSSARRTSAVGSVTVLDINGAIGPATSRYIEKGIKAAEARGSRLIVLEMDTPGGLDSSMRDIVRVILGSSVPVATYVSPSGARAASAGAYIMYASHIAAMAPATNIGAATPVSIGGSPPPAEPERPGTSPSDEKDRDKTDGEEGDARAGAKSPSGASEPEIRDEGDGAGADDDKKRRERARDRKAPEPANAMERKAVNDAVAYIRGLAELRGRNADWAEEAVREAASLSATDALKQGVIDVIAKDLPDLLDQIDGREVKVGDTTVQLATRGLTVEHVEPDWRTKLLSVITNPTIAYGLLLIGIYGLLFEGYNPGAIVPGVVGAIALITALFAFQILSVNYAGLALIALGVAMMIAEFFVPSFGALGLGGLVAFVVGSIILLDTDTPGLNLGLPIVAGVATVGGAIVVAIAWFAKRSIGAPVVTGLQAMVGATAEVVEDFTGRGLVRFGGELWNAHSTVPLQRGQLVRITRAEGLQVWVEPL